MDTRVFTTVTLPKTKVLEKYYYSCFIEHPMMLVYLTNLLSLRSVPRFKEHKILPYTPRQMYDLVLDIKKYPEFLPWCVGAGIRQQNEEELVATLTIGYKLIHETFLSRVTYEPGHFIKVHYLRGPFKHLDNEWRFTPHGHDHCEVDFFVDFEFNVGLLNRVANRMFLEITHRMVQAFESRARKLYENPHFKSLG